MPAALAVLLASSAMAQAEPLPIYGARLEGFEYPHPVKTFALDSQAQPLEMAYLDVAPATPNGRTVVLLHGKNFCAATWKAAIAALVDAGYREDFLWLLSKDGKTFTQLSIYAFLPPLTGGGVCGGIGTKH